MLFRSVTAEPSVAIEPRETVETTDAPVVYDLAAPIPAPRRVVISRPVPEVTGLSTRAAVRALHRAGFRVVIDATGAVGETSPAVGTMLPSGSVVRFAPSRGGAR